MAVAIAALSPHHFAGCSRRGMEEQAQDRVGGFLSKWIAGHKPASQDPSSELPIAFCARQTKTRDPRVTVHSDISTGTGI